MDGRASHTRQSLLQRSHFVSIVQNLSTLCNGHIMYESSRLVDIVSILFPGFVFLFDCFVYNKQLTSEALTQNR